MARWFFASAFVLCAVACGVEFSGSDPPDGVGGDDSLGVGAGSVGGIGTAGGVNAAAGGGGGIGTGGMAVGGMAGGVGGGGNEGGDGARELSCDLTNQFMCNVNDPTACLCDGCSNNQWCATNEDCICPDCQFLVVCSAACDNDGYCQPFFETCACADCAAHSFCKD